MNISVFTTEDYENKPGFAGQENKPNQSQSGNRIQKTEFRRQKAEDRRLPVRQAQGGLRVCSWCVLYRVIGSHYDIGSV